MGLYWDEVTRLANRVAVSGKNIADFFKLVPEPWKDADLKAFRVLHEELLSAQDAYRAFDHSKVAEE